MIRLVIFALALTVFCKLFLNQEEVPPVQAKTPETSEVHERKLAKDSSPSTRSIEPSS